MDNTIIDKIYTIQRCMKRINEEFTDEGEFRENLTKQDSVILNLKRASQATIDIAIHTIKNKKIGIPNSSREVFEILNNYSYITDKTTTNMQNMVGFKNIVVHDYQNLNIDIVISIVKNHLIDFKKFSDEILKV